MTEKNYTLSVHDDHVYVERAPNAEVAMADQKVMIEEIMQTCRETGCRNVIVAGAAVKVGLSTLDLLQIGNEVANARLRVAVVEDHDASTDDVSFLENVAWNRGGLIRFFDTDADARDWLGID